MHTNKTPNLGLPQWLGTDTPDWLTDMNNAFADIDTNAGNQVKVNDANNTYIENLIDQQGKMETELEQLAEQSGNISADLAPLKAQVQVNTQHLADVDKGLENANKAITTNQAGTETAIQNLNSSIESTQTDLATANGKINTLETEVETSNTTADSALQKSAANETSIATLQQSVTYNTAAIKELQNSAGNKTFHSLLYTTNFTGTDGEQTTVKFSKSGQIYKCQITNKEGEDTEFLVRFVIPYSNASTVMSIRLKAENNNDNVIISNMSAFLNPRSEPDKIFISYSVYIPQSNDVTVSFEIGVLTVNGTEIKAVGVNNEAIFRHAMKRGVRI